MLGCSAIHADGNGRPAHDVHGLSKGSATGEARAGSGGVGEPVGQIRSQLAEKVDDHLGFEDLGNGLHSHKVWPCSNETFQSPGVEVSQGRSAHCRVPGVLRPIGEVSTVRANGGGDQGPAVCPLTGQGDGGVEVGIALLLGQARGDVPRVTRLIGRTDDDLSAGIDESPVRRDDLGRGLTQESGRPEPSGEVMAT